jgi:integrase
MSSPDQVPVHNAKLSLAGIIDIIEATDTISIARTRNSVSALRAIARALGQPPAAISADPVNLGKKLFGVRGVRHRAGVSKYSWKVYLARYRAATRLFGLAELPARVDVERSPTWRALLSQLPASHAKYLGRFAGVMTLNGVEPSEVGTDHFEFYRVYIAKAAIRTGEHAFRWMCHYWERARAEVPGWPDTAAPIIPRRKLVWLPWSAFPASLEPDIDSYYACRVQAREFDIDTLFDGTPTKRIRANTARNYKEYLQGVASAAVAAGVSAEDIHHLADLLGPAVLERAITQLVKRRAQLAGRSGANAPSMELPAGRYTFDIVHHVHHVMKNIGCPPAQLIRVKAALEKLARAEAGMSKRTRSQLEIIRQPAVFRAVFMLPERIFMELRDLEHPTVQDAWRCAAALVLAISFDTAFRRGNAIKLRLSHHLGMIDPKTGRMPIVVPGDETKNGETYVAELRSRTVRLLEEYLQHWRLLIDDTSSDYVFPLNGLGDPDRESAALIRLAGRVSRMVCSRLDIDFHLHLLRSLLATLYAEANPGDIQTAQLKLGHKSARTTQAFYIDVDQRNAHHRFDAVINELIEPATGSSAQKDRGDRHDRL